MPMRLYQYFFATFASSFKTFHYEKEYHFLFVRDYYRIVCIL